MTERESSWRLREAADDAYDLPEQPGGGGAAGYGYRHGVAVIDDASDGDGTYTITEQQWNGSAWIDGTAPACLDGADARDIAERDTGEDGDYVPFWEQRAVGGGVDILIDVGGSVGEIADQTGISVWSLKHVDVNLSDDLTHYYTLDTRDWRGRHVWVSALWLDGATGADPGESDLWTWFTRTDSNGPVLARAMTYAGAVCSRIHNIMANASGDDLSAYVAIDGTDSGKLKLEVDNADGNRYQIWIRADGTARHNHATADITSPDA